MSEDKIKVGSYVRNKRSGSIGVVMGKPRTEEGTPLVRVMVIKPKQNIIKFRVYWALKNVEPLN